MPSLVDVAARPPANPPIPVQHKFVGSSLKPAFEEAERYVDACFDDWPAAFDGDGRVLDFGSGWGRISRMLLRRIEPGRLWSSDVDIEMTALLQQSLPGVNAVTNAAFPPTVFADAAFEVVTAFSVFSHLSEDAQRAWAAEFSRIVRPGGRVFITTLEEGFIDQIASCQRAVEGGATDGFSVGLARLIPDLEAARAAVQRGEFLYAAGGMVPDGPRLSTFYSWAVAPRAWVERTWGDAGFKLLRWLPTGTLFEQAYVVLERA